jgi:hypothetical protein
MAYRTYDDWAEAFKLPANVFVKDPCHFFEAECASSESFDIPYLFENLVDNVISELNNCLNEDAGDAEVVKHINVGMNVGHAFPAIDHHDVTDVELDFAITLLRKILQQCPPYLNLPMPFPMSNMNGSTQNNCWFISCVNALVDCSAVLKLIKQTPVAWISCELVPG